MKLVYALRTVGSQSPDQTNTHLQGGWLAFARVVWGVLVLFILCMFIASLPVSFATLNVPCTAVACSEIVGQLTRSDVQALRHLGLSLTTYAYYWISLNAMVGLVWCLMGSFLVWRKSNDWLLLLVALMLISVGTGTITDNLLFSSSIWLIPENCLYLIKSLAILFSLALFPNGRFVPRWTGWIPLIYPTQMVVYLLFFYHLYLHGWSLYRNPLNAVSWFGCEGAMVVAQLYRYLRVSNRVERQQTRWVAFSFLILLVADFGETAAMKFFSIQHIGLFYILILSIFTCMFLAFPFAVGIAILRYRLWDIDLIINRALVYGLLTVCVVGIYVLVVGYLGALFRTSNSLPVSLLATCLVAVLFQPLRERLQRGANRLFYGQRDEPYAVITRLSRRLEATLTPDTVLATIVETVTQALKLPYAAILLQDDDALTIAASYGNQPADLLTFPLVYQRETIGKLLLAPRAPGEALTPADLRLLSELTRQVSLVARTVLSASPDFAVVGEATTGEEAIELSAALQPDVILMDIQMPGVNGIEATRSILHTSPHIRILIVTMFEDDASVFTAMRAGARGYVLKDAQKGDMLQAIHAVGRGDAIFSPAIATRLIDFFAAPRPVAPPQVFPELTEREREILNLIAQGHSNTEIATRLVLSPHTVRNYVSNVFSKLQVADRAQAIIRAREAGLG